MAGEQTLNYFDQDTGKLNIGGEFEFLAAATFKIDGTTMSLTALKALSAGELAFLDGLTAGTVTASKAVVVGATKNIDTLLFDVASPAAAGSVQGDGTAMTADTNLVTAADGTKGVVLPTAVAGRRILVKNTHATNLLKVYPATGAQINALGANNAQSVPGGCLVLYAAASATLWYATALLPDGVTASAAELNFLDGATAGTQVASKAVVADANVNTGVSKVTELHIGATGAEAQVTSTPAELNLLDDAVAGTAVASKALALGATKNIDTLLFDIATPAGAGTIQGDATAMTADTNLVTGADGTVGVILPTAVAGRRVVVKNTVADQILKVYPATGAAINALGANVNIALPGGTVAVFYAETATQWWASAIPDGITATAAEINVLDGATAGTQVASKAVVADANVNTGVVKATELHVGATGAEVQIASTPAQIDAAVAGTPLVYRANHLAAAIIAGTAEAVPAVAGKSFCVLDIRMRAKGGAVSGPTTVEVVEETSGEVFLSHVIADLTEDTWVGQVEGTPVITGITAGGMVVANKALLVTDTGGTDFATATSLDTIVVGYYTTT